MKSWLGLHLAMLHNLHQNYLTCIPSQICLLIDWTAYLLPDTSCMLREWSVLCNWCHREELTSLYFHTKNVTHMATLTETHRVIPCDNQIIFCFIYHWIVFMWSYVKLFYLFVFTSRCIKTEWFNQVTSSSSVFYIAK